MQLDNVRRTGDSGTSDSQLRTNLFQGGYVKEGSTGERPLQEKSANQDLVDKGSIPNLQLWFGTDTKGDTKDKQTKDDNDSREKEKSQKEKPEKPGERPQGDDTRQERQRQERQGEKPEQGDRKPSEKQGDAREKAEKPGDKPAEKERMPGEKEIGNGTMHHKWSEQKTNHERFRSTDPNKHQSNNVTYDKATGRVKQFEVHSTDGTYIFRPQADGTVKMFRVRGDEAAPGPTMKGNMTIGKDGVITFKGSNGETWQVKPGNDVPDKVRRSVKD